MKCISSPEQNRQHETEGQFQVLEVHFIGQIYHFREKAHHNRSGKDVYQIYDNDYEVRILKGVDDLTHYVIGAELVIDDDGKTYKSR